MVKLSLIIPYFETYDLTLNLLRELSLQKNGNDEIEIILIDDYCENEFKKTKVDKDDILNKGKIVVVEHKTNQGTAISRNEGIDLAKGKYVAFIDCDDQITMDYCATLLNAIDKYDTDIINFNWYDMTQHIEVRKPDNYAMWKAIYKKETMPHFMEGLGYGHEDVPFQGEIEEGIRTGKYTITYLDKLLYLYNSNRVGSLIWKKTHQGE